MLTFLELENFKSFSKIKLDLRKSYGEPKKLAFIYGENGSGKTNLLSSLLFLIQSQTTLKNQLNIKEISNLKDIVNNIEDKEIQQEIFNHLFKLKFSTLSDLIEKYKMIGSAETMSLKFGFRINDADGYYLMLCSNRKIVKEELRYQINEREGNIFSINETNTILSPGIFSDSIFRKELTENIEKYWGKHSFIAILFNELETKNAKYIESKLNSNLLNVLSWFRRLSIMCKECSGETARISIPFEFMTQLSSGSVEDKNNSELKACESALNTFFTQLYSDIKEVYYRLLPEDNGYSYELIFKKLVDGKIIEVPISLESTGTQKLLEIFPMLFSGVFGTSVFIDEIDSGIHDMLMKNILEILEDSLQGQFIATTHNTLLMENLPPESIYIIRINANGNKSINCVADYDKRTQKNNNIKNKYLRGDYEGVPYTGYFDFLDLANNVVSRTNPSDFSDGGFN